MKLPSTVSTLCDSSSWRRCFAFSNVNLLMFSMCVSRKSIVCISGKVVNRARGISFNRDSRNSNQYGRGYSEYGVVTTCRRENHFAIGQQQSCRKTARRLTSVQPSALWWLGEEATIQIRWWFCIATVSASARGADKGGTVAQPPRIGRGKAQGWAGLDSPQILFARSDRFFLGFGSAFSCLVPVPCTPCRSKSRKGIPAPREEGRRASASEYLHFAFATEVPSGHGGTVEVTTLFALRDSTPGAIEGIRGKRSVKRGTGLRPSSSHFFLLLRESGGSHFEIIIIVVVVAVTGAIYVAEHGIASFRESGPIPAKRTIIVHPARVVYMKLGGMPRGGKGNRRVQRSTAITASHTDSSKELHCCNDDDDDNVSTLRTFE
uniref:Uncharacterized protein n=1 Tax=Anopheles farauti TaxID=69004 RepID=A0A182QDZ8_9DIPT